LRNLYIRPSPNLCKIPHRRHNADQNPDENRQEEGTGQHLCTHPVPHQNKIRKKKIKQPAKIQETRPQEKAKRGALIPVGNGNRHKNRVERQTKKKSFGFYFQQVRKRYCSFPLLVDRNRRGRKYATGEQHPTALPAADPPTREMQRSNRKKRRTRLAAAAPGGLELGREHAADGDEKPVASPPQESSEPARALLLPPSLFFNLCVSCGLAPARFLFPAQAARTRERGVSSLRWLFASPSRLSSHSHPLHSLTPTRKPFLSVFFSFFFSLCCSITAAHTQCHSSVL
jgi:hypothetical protein